MDVPSLSRGRARRRRARAALLALTTATALTISGCASRSGDGGGDSTTLTVWLPGTNQTEIDLVTNTIVPAFEKKTGAHVQVTYVDWGEISTKLNSAFAAGTAPDIFGHGPAAAADFVANDRILNLDDRVAALSAQDRDDLATALSGGQVKGKQYLVPLSMQGYLVMYDADAFRAAGLDPDAPPTTWEQVRADAEKLTVRDGTGRITRSGFLTPSQAIARQQSFATFLFGAGGALVNDAGTKATFNSSKGVAALEFFTNLYSGDGAVSAHLGEDYLNAPPAQQPLVQGSAAMTIQSPSMMQQIVKAAPGRDLRVMPALSFRGSEPAALGGAGPGLMINADAKNPDLAWSFIEFMLSPDVSTRYTQGTGSIPVRASAANSDYAKNSPVVREFLAQSVALRTNPNVVGWVKVRDALDKQLERALNGVASAKDSLDEAAAQADKILAANG